MIVSMGLTSVPIISKSYLQFYQFIDVLYNLRWVLSSSGERLMEFYDPLVRSDSMSVCTVLCSALSTRCT